MPKPAVATLSLCLLLALAAPASAAPPAQDTAPEMLTLILDSPDRPGLPRHFHTAGDGWSPDLADPPSRQGLDGLRVSGSAQFSRAQLLELLERLPRPLTVVDLRQESHGFLSGQAVSWYGPRDWASQGKTLDQVHEDEMVLLERASTLGRLQAAEIIRLDPQGGIAQAEQFILEVTSAQTEAQLLAMYGLGYLRLPVTDHLRPTDQVVEEFMAFWRGMPAETWLHFHCHGGAGRTTTFMLMADILANAHQVSFVDLARRQQLLGGVDLLNSPPGNWKREGYQERAAFLQAFYYYVRQSPPGRPGSWTAWLDSQRDDPRDNRGAVLAPGP
jgi:hypothetical protein